MIINLLQNGMLDPTSLSNKIRECIEFHEEHCEY